MSTTARPMPADEVEAGPGPNCPECGEPMECYGGKNGYICHDWKLLYRAGGWFDAAGVHVDDDRVSKDWTRDIRRH